MGSEIWFVYARSQLRWTLPLIGQQELVPAVVVIFLDSLYLLGRCLPNTLRHLMTINLAVSVLKTVVCMLHL